MLHYDQGKLGVKLGRYARNVQLYYTCLKLIGKQWWIILT